MQIKKTAYSHEQPAHHNKLEILKREIKNLKEQLTVLSTNMSEMMAKLINLENSDIDYRSSVQSHQKQEKESNSIDFQCDQCEYKCNRELTLKKHTNTIHPASVEQFDLTCVFCKGNFSSQKELNEHLSEHLEEIREMEPRHLTNKDGSFKCRICDFKSINENAIKKTFSRTH